MSDAIELSAPQMCSRRRAVIEWCACLWVSVLIVLGVVAMLLVYLGSRPVRMFSRGNRLIALRRI